MKLAVYVVWSFLAWFQYKDHKQITSIAFVVSRSPKYKVHTKDLYLIKMLTRIFFAAFLWRVNSVVVFWFSGKLIICLSYSVLSLFRHFFQKVLNTRTRYENVQLKNDFALPVVGVAPVESILDKRELLVIIVTNILPITMVRCNSHTSYFQVERSFLFLNALKPLKSKASGPSGAFRKHLG